jgi:hypothetical protein
VLDRLDAITELLVLQEIEITRQEVAQIIESGSTKIKGLTMHFKDLILGTPYSLAQEFLHPQKEIHSEMCRSIVLFQQPLSLLPISSISSSKS